MDEHHDNSARRRVHQAERALVAAVRVALLPALGLPVSVAVAAASVTGTGLRLWLAWPLATLAAAANFACWREVIRRWRRLPRHDDDDEEWHRWHDGSRPPPGPAGGPDGVEFDWPSFELQFWAHVRALDRELAAVSSY